MVKTTKSFVLRLDAATMQAVEKWAADEFRSTNGQLQWIIADALRRNRRLPKHAPSAPPSTDETGKGTEDNTNLT
ncbi:MAG TPA: DNA-binding protein [Prevotella sp.]|nr:DNA-binding protein [Prevotella sp.]